MIKNNITSHRRLIVDTMHVSLQQWFAVHLFMLKQILTCSRHYLVELVEQCVIDGYRTIFYKRGLSTLDPSYFNYLTNFAYKFDLQLLEDRRVKHIYVPHDRRKIPLLILLSITLVSNSAVAVDQMKNTQLTKHTLEQQEVMRLLGWIRFKMSQLEFEVSNQLPSIKRLSRSQIYKMALGSNMSRISNKKMSASIYGLYNYENETIYLLDSIDISKTKGKAILLHELVHYLQYQNGHDEKVECKNRLEYLAYQLEAAYLKEHGEPVAFSHDHLRRVVQCH